MADSSNMKMDSIISQVVRVIYQPDLFQELIRNMLDQIILYLAYLRFQNKAVVYTTLAIEIIDGVFSGSISSQSYTNCI